MFRSTDTQTPAWRPAGLITAFLVFSSPTWWLRLRGTWPSYIPATLALTTVLAAVVITWSRTRPLSSRTRPRTVVIALAAAATALLVAGAYRWIALVLVTPIDPNHADMLPVIAQALGRVLHGRDPYTIYHVPWDAPLGYGPVLWAPFLVPYLLHVDLRLTTLVGELVIPICCAAVAVVESVRGRWLTASLWAVLLATILWNPDLTYFTPVGHTPAFWPLLPLFAVLVTAELWSAAAVVLGLIVVGRSTMIAGVPIFFMRVWVTDRPRVLKTLALWLAPIVVLMGPFALWDPHALWYGMVAVYPRVIKAIVWPSADEGIAHTIGITGWLVTHHHERLVEATQGVLVAAAWASGWMAIRRGARPLPWMALAVFAFCMGTLWPLYYIYFDVLLLLVCGAAAEALVIRVPRAQWIAWAGTLACSVAIVLIGVRLAAPRFPDLDLTAPGSSRWLYQGFATSRRAGEPAMPWIWGLDGTVALPRSSTTNTEIAIAASPVLPADTPYQAVTAILNGRLLGTVHAARGWQTLRFAAPSGSWVVGSNELKIVCSTLARPAWIGMSDDPRQLSLAIRRISVVPEHDDRVAR